MGNVRAKSFFLARTKIDCGQCGRETAVLALVAPPGHDSGDPDDVDVWAPSSGHAFLFYVAEVPKTLHPAIFEIPRTWRADRSAITQSSCWLNHCEHCQCVIEDHDLHCEPQGAFVPISEQAARSVTLTRVGRALEVLADGYSLEPDFVHAMRRP